MGQTPANSFRDFLYLDAAKLHNFSSVMQGGLASEISERIKSLGELSGSLKLGFGEFGANFGGSKEREREQTQVLQVTDPVLFDGVYRALKTQGLKSMDNLNSESREDLKVNDFVELIGDANPPVIEAWIDQLQMLLALFRRYESVMKTSAAPPIKGAGRKSRTSPQPASGIAQFEAITNLLIEYMNAARRDPGKRYIRVTLSTDGIHAWCGLLPEFIVVPNADFAARVTIIGQVERLPRKHEESWKLVDLSRFTNQEAATSLLQALNSLPMGVPPLKEEDFIAEFPDIFIRPLAIFR